MFNTSKKLKGFWFYFTGQYVKLALADLGGRAERATPYGSRFFRFDMQIFRNVAASGVHGPPLRGPCPPLREILDPPLIRVNKNKRICCGLPCNCIFPNGYTNKKITKYRMSYKCPVMITFRGIMGFVMSLCTCTSDI